MKAPPCQFNEIVHTALSGEDISNRLSTFFGKGGLGLGMKVDCPGRLIFNDGEDYVSATIRMEGNGTLLNIVTSGKAVQVRRFVSELP